MKRALFTHEYLRTRGPLAGMFAQFAAVALAGTLLLATPVNLLATFGAMITVVTVAALLPAVVIVLTIDYWRSGYGRGGYLTHSLPVKGSTAYGVRLAYGAVVLLVAFVANLLLAAPPVLLEASQQAPAGVGTIEYITGAMQATDPPLTAGLLALGAAFILLSAFGYLALFYFAVSYGNESRFARLGLAGPIVVWLAVYVVVQIACLIGVVLIPLGADYVNGGFTLITHDWLDVMTNNRQVRGAPLGFVPVLVAAALLQIWRTAYSWDRRVSLR